MNQDKPNMDEVVRRERVEARKALGEANLPYVIDGNTGDLLNSHLETVADFFYNDEDVHLCANAPTWLRNSLNREEQLIAENERLRAAKVELWDCPDCGFAFDAIHTDDGTDGEYSCPLCAEGNLTAKVAEQDKKIQKLKDFILKHV